MFSLFSRPAIQPDEAVLIYPAFAHWDRAKQQWVAALTACVFESDEPSLWPSALARMLRPVLGKADDEEELRECRERLRLFLVDHERGKRVSVRIGGVEIALGTTQANGQTSADVALPAAAAGACTGPSAAHRHGWLRCQVVLPPADRREFAGQLQCIPPQGVSVISDLDDTIKQTGAWDRHEMLRNTFYRPWQPVAGMAGTYQLWATKGAVFHYLSASPWQLFPALEDFRGDFHFPPGSWTLKPVRFTDSTVLDLFSGPEKFKAPQIERLFSRFPQRKFVMVGDSGEKDPEIYAGIARRFPEQVLRIFIREVPGAERPRSALDSLFAGLPAKMWRVFGDPKEIMDAIPHHAF